jgi:hypothetical protein
MPLKKNRDCFFFNFQIIFPSSRHHVITSSCAAQERQRPSRHRAKHIHFPIHYRISTLTYAPLCLIFGSFANAPQKIRDCIFFNFQISKFSNCFSRHLVIVRSTFIFKFPYFQISTLVSIHTLIDTIFW